MIRGKGKKRESMKKAERAWLVSWKEKWAVPQPTRSFKEKVTNYAAG